MSDSEPGEEKTKIFQVKDIMLVPLLRLLVIP